MKITQDWLDPLSLAIQGTILCAVRGPDGMPKVCLGKELTRAFRAATMINAHSKGTPGDDFMGDYSGYCSLELIEEFCEEHDQYPHHWLMHLIHAGEILGYLHPDQMVREFWHRFYIRMCRSFHMHPESLSEMMIRLREKRPDSSYVDIQAFETAPK